MKRSTQALIVLAVLAVGGLYLHGTFDRALSGVGLNYHECARNGLGATFCGEELTNYRERIAQSKRESEAVATHLHEQAVAGEQQAKLDRLASVDREMRALDSKLEQEKKIIEREPEGSYASDLARDEYEGDRAQLQQLGVR